MRHVLATALATLLLAACGEGEEGGATMRPGSSCLASGCHAGGEHAFTAAGTIYGAGDAAEGAGLAGVTVTLSGSGRTAVLTTNAAGNFFTTQALGSSISVTVSGNGGTVSRPSHHGGACGGCHQPGNAQGAPARVHVCASCHAA
jgi:hypothetical protein